MSNEAAHSDQPESAPENEVFIPATLDTRDLHYIMGMLTADARVTSQAIARVKAQGTPEMLEFLETDFARLTDLITKIAPHVSDGLYAAPF